MIRLFALATFALMPVAANAIIVVNGNFEAGGGSLVGWTIESGNVAALDGQAYITFAGGSGSVAAAANNFASFDAGNTSGINTLAQTIATASGNPYSVSFDYGLFGGGTQQIDFLINDVVVMSFNPSGTSNLDALFTNFTTSFVATGALTKLSFSADSTGGAGDGRDPFIDNVSVTSVPEAASWAMLIAGFGIVGAVARRRRVALPA